MIFILDRLCVCFLKNIFVDLGKGDFDEYKQDYKEGLICKHDSNFTGKSLSLWLFFQG